jgi:hypothetical protein
MTRKTLGLATLAALITLAAPAGVQAQQDSASARSRGAPDAAASITLTGVTVVRVDTTSGGLHAVVASGTDSMNVMLAPADFLTSKSLTIAAGDVLDIAGSRVVVGGKPALIATEIKKGETKVMLRDKATGTPAWTPARTP